MKVTFKSLFGIKISKSTKKYNDQGQIKEEQLTEILLGNEFLILELRRIFLIKKALIVYAYGKFDSDGNAKFIFKIVSRNGMHSFSDLYLGNFSFNSEYLIITSEPNLRNFIEVCSFVKKRFHSHKHDEKPVKSSLKSYYIPARIYLPTLKRLIKCRTYMMAWDFCVKNHMKISQDTMEFYI